MLDGKVVRLLGVSEQADEGISDACDVTVVVLRVSDGCCAMLLVLLLLLLDTKVNTRGPFCSCGWADNGGVAVMALGNMIWLCAVAMAGDIGCAVRGVSRYGPK